MNGADVTVVGAGVIGAATAYYVARAGARVTLVDRVRPPAGATASGASAGGVSQMARALPEVPLAAYSGKLWPTLAAELEMDIGYHQHGGTYCIDREEDRPLLAARIARDHAGGLTEVKMLEGDELRRMEPGVSPRVVAGSHCPTDGAADPMRTTVAFIKAAERLGASVLTDCAVTGVHRSGHRITGVATARGRISADLTIIAAGTWSAPLARMAGVDLPIRVGGLQVMVTARRPPALKQVLGWVGHGISLKQSPHGGFVIGGGWPGEGEPSRYETRLLPGSLAQSAQTAIELYPSLVGVPVVRAWVGLEGFCPDELPIIGPVAHLEGCWIAAGFSSHGFTLAPGVGSLLARWAVSGSAPTLLRPFSLHRFDRGES